MGLETVDFRRFPLRAGDRLLDLGCGEGRHALEAWCGGRADVIAADLTLSDLATVRDRRAALAGERAASADNALHLLATDALRLPFADGTFDRVVCSEVLEHLPDYETALDEICRVLKPGGLLAVSVPRFGPEWVCWKLSRGYRETPGGHVRIFKRGELLHAARMRELICYASHWAHALHSPYWWLKCLFWERADHALVRAYHRLLVWDLMSRPPLTRLLEQLLNPLIGKSTVLYFVRGSR
jgi:SAM-dependent methyltransferase